MSVLHFNDSVHWHIEELTSRIVAESGIPTDRFHQGKIIFQSLKDNPNRILQIDAATGKSETSADVLRRSVICAVGLKAMGLQCGDVISLMAPLHTDLAIPFYAALYLGIAIAPTDMTLRIDELKNCFETARPKMVFCQSEKVKDVKTALEETCCEATIVTFDKSDQYSFEQLLHQSEEDLQHFRVADFDPSETVAFVISTSGTTGPPKLAALTHKNVAISGRYFWCRSTEFPPFATAMVAAPLQWLSAIVIFLCGTYLGFTRLQSSQALTKENAYHMINTYKPQFTLLSPTFMTTLLKPDDCNSCDIACFKTIMLAGSAVPKDLILQIKNISPDTDVVNTYGMSEMSGVAFVHGHSSPPESCGKPAGCFQYKLVDFNTGKEICDANKNGELWLKGPGLFQISPVEVEAVIRQHPKVFDVVVTGIPDPECGELPVACIVPRPGQAPTAQEIKDLVKASMSDSKQLRGGVIFMDQLPTTASTKVHRMKIREMVLHMDRK